MIAAIRAQKQTRTARVELERPIRFIPNPLFKRRDANEQIEAMRPVEEPPNCPCLPPNGLPAYMAALFRCPLLSPKRETYLFLRMNFEKFRAEHFRKRIANSKSGVKHEGRMESHLARASLVRDQIVEANLRLLVSIAKKFVDQNNSFEEMIAEGHLPLLRAAELFDIARGFKFSTYATHAIHNGLNRMRTNTKKHAGRFVTMDSGILDEVPAEANDSEREEERFQRLQAAVSSLLNSLDEREQKIVGSRFGLLGYESPQSFAGIARQIGLSKERVRQISIHALQKLENVAVAGLQINA